MAISESTAASETNLGESPQDAISVECGHLSATINLLKAGIDSGLIKVVECDMRSGTVDNALYGLQRGIDRIDSLLSRWGELHQAGGAA